LGLLHGWLYIGAIGPFIAVVLHLCRANIVGLLFVTQFFYFFIQQWFRVYTAIISTLQASF
jgi:hypothetical protein